MRLTYFNFKNVKTPLTRGVGRARQREESVQFRELLPLQIKNKISTKRDKSGADVGCIQDMAVMFACLKENNFVESLCSKEIKTFKDCYDQHMKSRSLARKQAAAGELIPGAKTLPSKSLNKLLKKYPQFNDPSIKVENP